MARTKTLVQVTVEVRDLLKVAAALEGESVLNMVDRVLVPVLAAYVRERAAYLAAHGQIRIGRRSQKAIARHAAKG